MTAGGRNVSAAHDTVRCCCLLQLYPLFTLDRMDAVVSVLICSFLYFYKCNSQPSNLAGS